MQQVHTATARGLSRATSAHSGDERARDDRRRYGSCRRARRPGALRKLSARETTRRATEAAGARDGRAQEGAESDKRYISGDQPVERDQCRELPDEPNTSRSA